MVTARQRSEARRNIKKAAAAARRKRSIAHLPKRTRTALGKQASKVARRTRGRFFALTAKYLHSCIQQESSFSADSLPVLHHLWRNWKCHLPHPVESLSTSV